MTELEMLLALANGYLDEMEKILNAIDKGLANRSDDNAS